MSKPEIPAMQFDDLLTSCDGPGRQFEPEWRLILPEDAMSRDEQAARNIKLVGRYLEHLLDHPEEIEELDGSEIVLVPDDDSDLKAANLALAEHLGARRPEAQSEQPVQVKTA